jgi:hypothetical protein
MTEPSRVRLCSMTPPERLPALPKWRLETINGTLLAVEARNETMAMDGFPAGSIKSIERVG